MGPCRPPDGGARRGRAGGGARAQSRSFTKRLLRVVEQSELLTPEQIAAAVDRAQRDNLPVSAAIVQEARIEETELLGLLADRLKVTPINLHDCRLDRETLQLIPKDLAYDHSLVPISKIENVLTIAVSNPFDVVILDQIRNTTGCQLRLVIALEDTIQRTLNGVHKPGAAQLEAVMGEMEGGDSLDLKKSDVEDAADLRSVTLA